MLARVCSIARLLVGPRNSKLRRRVQRIQLKRVLESINRLRKLPRLRVGCPDKIPTVGIVRVHLNHVSKRVDRPLRIVRVLVQQSQVEPGMRILGIPFHRRFEQFLRGIHPREIQQRNPRIQLRNR